MSSARDDRIPFTAEGEVVDVSDITRDRGLQPRHGLDAWTVQEYANAMRRGTPFPPVHLGRITGPTGVESLILIDGWHRLAAAESLDLKEVRARITDMSRRGAMRAAAIANLSHGLRLSTSDRYRALELFIKSGRHKDGRRFKSYREMERDMQGSMSYSTIRRHIRANFPAIARAMQEASGGSNEDPPATGGTGLRVSTAPTIGGLLRDLKGLVPHIADTADCPALAREIQELARYVMAHKEALEDAGVEPGDF